MEILLNSFFFLTDMAKKKKKIKVMSKIKILSVHINFIGVANEF